MIVMNIIEKLFHRVKSERESSRLEKEEKGKKANSFLVQRAEQSECIHRANSIIVSTGSYRVYVLQCPNVLWMWNFIFRPIFSFIFSRIAQFSLLFLPSAAREHRR